MSYDLMSKYRKPWDVTEEETEYYTSEQGTMPAAPSTTFTQPCGEAETYETHQEAAYSNGYETYSSEPLNVAPTYYDSSFTSDFSSIPPLRPPSSASSSSSSAFVEEGQGYETESAAVVPEEEPVVVEQVVVTRSLSRQSLVKLPAELFDEHETTHLDLSYNMLAHIEPRISNLSNLRSLNLEYNDFGSTPMLWFRFLENLIFLEELNLSNNKLTQVPSSVGDCLNLKALKLNGNELVEISGLVLRNLRHLELLELSSNRLNKLPDEITYLSSLKKLNAYDNNLHTLPQGLRFPTSLEELDLSKNRLKHLHPIVFGIATATYIGEEWRYDGNAERQLRILRASQNQIDVIDEELFYERFPNLEELLFSSNVLMQLPQSIGFLHKLRVMDVSDNKLYSIPSCIRFCFSLSYINLSNNHLGYLPYSIGRLSNLEFLSVSDNQLTELPYTICRLSNLKNLGLQNNFLKTLPPLVADMKFEFISLEGNACPDIPQEIVEKGTPAILDYLKDHPSKEPEGEFEFVGEISENEDDVFFCTNEDIERDGGWIYNFITKPPPAPAAPPKAPSSWLSYINPLAYFSKS